MAWINLLIISIGLFAASPPKFLTKHSLASLRFITMDGRFSYLQKKQGVLSMVSNFRSTDFLSDKSQSDFLVKGSRFKQRLIIETIPSMHQEMNVIKNHQIMVVDWGKILTTAIGKGRTPKLHLQDEWISFYDPIERVITIQNILTQKKYQIKLSLKTSPFFFPEVEMIGPDSVVYTDVNDKGITGIIQYNLMTQKNHIIYKSSQSAMRIELCQENGYLAIGEFPYDDVNRSTKIMHIALTGSTNLAGYSTLYSSTNSDLGNMVCTNKFIYFIKTLDQQRKINFKKTEAAKLDLKTKEIKILTELNHATQILSMDGRILVPFRGDFFVLEGEASLTDDKLKTPVNSNEELPFEI